MPIHHMQPMPMQVMNVPVQVNSTSLNTRRGPWSPLEDKKLLDLIAIFGPTNWVRILNSLATRTPKQCRERYHQNLKPSLNRSPITAEEGELIESLVAKYGKKWAEISRHLNGRSDNAIKNWWNGGASRKRRASLAHTNDDDHSSTAKSEPSITQHLNLSSSSVNSGGPLSKLNSGVNLVGQAPKKEEDEANKGQKEEQKEGQNSESYTDANRHNSQVQQSQIQHQQLPQPPQPASQHPQNPIAHLVSSYVPSNQPHVPHLPQISFKTLMFKEPGTAATHVTLPPIHGKPASRSASFDVSATHPLPPPSLPPISSTNKRRLLDENRRHSSANSMYSNHALTNSHPNLSGLYGGGQVTPPNYGSPLLLSTQVSRDNSVSHFELGANTGNSLRRSLLIAPDLFPNPLKDGPAHKRNVSQNLFNLPVLKPSTRFSVSLVTSVLPVTQSSNTSPLSNFNKGNSTSSLRKSEDESLDEKAEDKTKIAVSSLID